LGGAVLALCAAAAVAVAGISTVAATAGYSPNRYVYCLGDPGWNYWRTVEDGAGQNGWWYNDTSAGWGRQFPPGLPQRVSFDDSVSVMQSVTDAAGQPCHTVKAEIQPHDVDARGGTSNQRAQLASDSSRMTGAFYGSQPALTPVPGQNWWYGFAFATNPGYTPHYDPTFGNWNSIFSWHNWYIGNSYGPLAPINLEVATIGPSTGENSYMCGSTMTKLFQPRLEVQLNGGNEDDPNWPKEDGQLTCRRYLGPVFQPGHLYRVQMYLNWDATMHGALQVWIDGTRYVDVSGISNMWYSGSTIDQNMYPIFENYRAYDTTLPTNDVYYGGLIRGSTQTDVAIRPGQNRLRPKRRAALPTGTRAAAAKAHSQ
jgi:hypothetical protein